MPRTYDDNVNYDTSLYNYAKFTTPTYEVKVGEELWFVGIDVGVTVLKDQNGVWRQVTSPVDSDLQAAQRVYRGGHTYEITPDEVDELTAAGFSAYIS